MSEPAAEPRQPWFKDPFVMAFVVGIGVLTLLPVMQGRFLKAPPPLSQMPAWSAVTSHGVHLDDRSTAGKVLLISLAPAPCDASCLELLTAFGRGLQHVDDLGGRITLVTVVTAGAEPTLAPLAAAHPDWQFVMGDATALVGGLRAGWEAFAHTDAGSTPAEFARFGGIALVDQQGAVRGLLADRRRRPGQRHQRGPPARQARPDALIHRP